MVLPGLGIEIIVGGVVYIVTNGTLAAIIIMLKKISKKKYMELASNIQDLMRRNTEIYTMLSEPPESQQISERTNEPVARELINEPITPSESEQDTHRDIQLANGSVLRIRKK